MSPFRHQYYNLLLIMVLLRQLPEDNFSEEFLKQKCEYDTKILCPECFHESTNCNDIALFKPQWNSWTNRINSLINRDGPQIGSFAGQHSLVVLNSLNRYKTIEKLLNEFCNIRSSLDMKCNWRDAGTVNHAISYLTKSVVNETRYDGCIICPSSTKELSLQRFLKTIGPNMNDLWKLLIIRTNVKPILLDLMSLRDNFFPVPKLLYTFGFSTIESYEGEPLSNFYNYSLLFRMLIAHKILKAAIAFTVGINGFRFLLTDLHSYNVVVKFNGNPSDISVSIVDLDSVIVIDTLAEGVSENYNWHVHNKIECDRCFAYVQADVCRYRNSDLNFFAICQLLLEDMNGNSVTGLLNIARLSPSNDFNATENVVALELHNLLEECVNCRPPACRNRSIIFENILNVIDHYVK